MGRTIVQPQSYRLVEEKVSRNGPRNLLSGDQSVIANTTSEKAPLNSVSKACRKSTAVRCGSLANAPQPQGTGPCTPPGHRHYGICPDLTTTLAVLFRRVADIFISWRPGDFTWDTLFGSAFEMDEELGEPRDCAVR